MPEEDEKLPETLATFLQAACAQEGPDRARHRRPGPALAPRGRPRARLAARVRPGADPSGREHARRRLPGSPAPARGRRDRAAPARRRRAAADRRDRARRVAAQARRAPAGRAARSPGGRQPALPPGGARGAAPLRPVRAAVAADRGSRRGRRWAVRPGARATRGRPRARARDRGLLASWLRRATG